METGTLRDIFYQHKGRLIHKWDHYFEIYERYFSAYKGKEISMLEIGISHGGSIELWKKYLGDKIHIYAIDVNPECKKFEDDQTTIFIGSQSDPEFLHKVLQQMPDLDFIIDDGGHTMVQQKVSFETLFLKVKEGGIYLVEDTHTSYWRKFYGELRHPGSFIEYCKSLVDSLYEHHLVSKDKVLLNDITRHINCIAFYDSIIVFDKKLRDNPFHIKVGQETIAPTEPPEIRQKSPLERIKEKVFPTKEDPFDHTDRGKWEQRT